VSVGSFMVSCSSRGRHTLARLLLTLCSFVLMVILGTLIGAFSGWIVDLFFEETILGILNSIQ
jgi:ABC-type microcin C transport system permease subunit YejE